MQCPKCGHEQVNTIECEACGIIFAKYRQRQETQPELTAIRSLRKPAKQPPYKLIGVVAAFLLLFLILIFTGGEDEVPVKSVEVASKPVEEAPAPTEDESKYRYYKKLTGYNLDRTFLRFQPDITNDHIDEFNYHWIRAYSCEYSAEIQQDKSRFYEVMRKVMDGALQYRYDYPVKYQYRGDVSVKVVSEVRNEIEVRPYIRVRTNLSGSREKQSSECRATRPMNTRHNLRFVPLRKGLAVEVPRKILDALDFPKRAFELEAEIKFRIEDATYEYLRSQRSFRIRHKAVIEELTLLNNDNAPRRERIFMTLSESQLY